MQGDGCNGAGPPVLIGFNDWGSPLVYTPLSSRASLSTCDVQQLVDLPEEQTKHVSSGFVPAPLLSSLPLYSPHIIGIALNKVILYCFIDLM